MQRLVLIRHAESVWNRDGIIQGFRDCDLSDLGLEQANRLRGRLEREPLDRAYSSTATRAMDTARVALGDRLAFETSDMLREINLGEWEGRAAVELKREQPVETDLWFRTPSKVRVPGGEPLRTFRRRVSREIDGLRDRHPEETIAVFTHGGVICTYLTHLLGLRLDDLWRFLVRNASVTRVIFPRGAPRLESLNDVAHLDGALRDIASPRLGPQAT